MKKSTLLPPLLLLCALLLFVASSHTALAARRRHSTSTSPPSAGSGPGVDANFFYQNLTTDEGTWFNTSDYGDVWQPKVAKDRPDWRPYTDGSWAQTDAGWTWVSNESFGWATYHYGRWTNNAQGLGWVWVPGYDWAPAWVAWRTSEQQQIASNDVVSEDFTPDASEPPPDAPPPTPPPPTTFAADGPAPENYIGWAPLPPEAVWEPNGFGPTVDATYEIAPEDYCFTSYRYFGYPVLSDVIFVPARNYYFVEHSFNVTAIHYYGGGRGSIYVGGPSFARVRALSERPIRSLALNRVTDPRQAGAAIGSHQFNQVQGNRLVVAAPRVLAPTRSTRLQRPPAARVQTIPRTDRPVASGVDSATTQRVREHVSQEARASSNSAGARSSRRSGVTSRSSSSVTRSRSSRSSGGSSISFFNPFGGGSRRSGGGGGMSSFTRAMSGLGRSTARQGGGGGSRSSRSSSNVNSSNKKSH
ncbi:MAG: hypothetical protein JO295_10255 [Verrucomicrobia bacterium]|nr:hypothetical protein [Verrucomicrobiota bacterium]